MAELTTEQKAERYDAAIRRAKSKIKNDKDHVLYEDDVLEIFPELAESYDERIRKALIDGFTVMEESKNCGKTFSKHNIPVADILAWLEKQGEKEKFIKKELENIHGYREEALRRLQELENQGEQKPAVEGTFINVDEVREDFVQEVYRVLDADSTNDRANQIIDAFDNLSTVTIQNHAEWCEADRARLQRIIDFLWRNRKGDTDSIYQQEQDIDWLKAIKDRVLPEPVELSETNEAVLYALIRRFEGEDIHVSKHLAVGCLKAILRQKQMKPGEEHYELEEFAKIVRGNLAGISKDAQKLFEAKYLQLTGNKMYGGFKD